MPAALEAALTLQHRGSSPQLQQRLREGEPLHLGGLQERGETAEQGGILHHQPIGEKPGQFQLRQISPIIVTAVDGLNAPLAEVVLLKGADRSPEKAVVMQPEILQFPTAQFAANVTAQAGAVEVKAQHLRFSPLPQTRLAGLFPLQGSTMPALTLDLLAQVVLQLHRQPCLAAGEALGHLLQVMAAHRRRRQLAQQHHQGGDSLLKLVGAGEILAFEHLLDLPVEPEGG